ncbi:MAG: UDP-N-acetylmuramate--L-alanine ligase [Clostridiales bacterium]|nr:UDP-N-acetylmuramate--L-alanine ligase [Clostridiales bacterium]
MYYVDFKNPIHVHFIGIGGISMSGLAEILLARKFTVSGSDNNASALTDHLASIGARIFIGQSAANISSDIDLVIYTAAIHEDNPELCKVRRLGIPVLSRAEFLGQLMLNYKDSIAVSGTHGKTTTTSMMSEILLENEMDPTISVGGVLKSIGGNVRVGNSETFITEACEYTNSFLNFYPRIAVILNIEEDHMDFFKDLADIRHSFHEFALRVPEKEGVLIINGEIPRFDSFVEDLDMKIITYGIGEGYDYSAINIKYDEFARGSFDLVKNGEVTAHIGLGVTGRHNVSNALPAIAVGDLLGIPMESIKKGLLNFTGTDRRFEYKGTCSGFTIIDDYAHHPTEITATLKTARRYPHNKTWCIFQPHTYTRTKAFFKEFAQALTIADHVILADIYAARETDTLGMSSELLAEEVNKAGGDAIYLPSFEAIEEYILSNCKDRDLVITMGAGNVVQIGEELLEKC